MLENTAIGRLVADPELKTVSVQGDNVSVCEFRLAINYGPKDKEITEFVNCVAWRNRAEAIAKYLSKGRKIWVKAHQKTKSYVISKDGVDFNQYKTDWIIDSFEFCDGNKTSNNNNDNNYSQSTNIPRSSQVPF